jgi:hypothetical protein
MVADVGDNPSVIISDLVCSGSEHLVGNERPLLRG